MRAYDIIKKKRDGLSLNKEEIDFIINGAVSGAVPDYQLSAFLMAVYFQGMTDDETANLTLAIANSGDKLDFSDIKGVRADKHSTGGVGDKTSLIVTPIVSSLGVKVAKMSGRGLGHTGGTVDKLESIDGFKVDLSSKDFISVVNESGAAIIGQTKNLAPADKILYALRDVTATVDSIPLIASSIMGKKLACDDDVIVLDVKTGSGAFMKDIAGAESLAKTMVATGKRANKKICAVISDMSEPLGRAVGNSLEVIEAVEVLRGGGEERLKELSLRLSAEILRLSGYGDLKKCLSLAKTAITSGAAIKAFENTVASQGGDISLIKNTNNFKKAKYSRSVCAEKEGYITLVDAEKYGLAALNLGAGRNKAGDKIDYTAGLYIHKKVGDHIRAGDKILTLFANNESLFDYSENLILNATVISDLNPEIKPIVIKTIE